MLVSRRSVLTTGITAGAAAAGAGALGVGATSASATSSRAISPNAKVTAAAARQAVARTASFPVGYSLGSNILWGTTAEIDQTLDSILAAGGTIVRMDIMWYWVQPTATTFDWSRVDYIVTAALTRGLGILGIILSCPAWAALGGTSDSTKRPRTAAVYGTFSSLVATRYRGRIAAYEIWNEPNGREAFSPDPDPTFYAAMLQAAYPAIKSADPAATVVAGAMGPAPLADGLIDPVTFLNGMYAAGAGGFFDALSFHPYEFDHDFVAGCLWDTTPMRRMIEMHAIMKSKGDGSKKIWISEYGSPTNVYTQQQQSDLISSSLLCWNEVSYAGSFFIYTVRDGTTAADSFGAVTHDFTPKTSLWAVQYLQAAGMPSRDEANAFATSIDQSLGGSVSPIYPMGGGYAQEFDNGTRFLTNNGWFSSPTRIGTVARTYQVVPTGTFANGRQDFDVPDGFAVFSSEATGSHAVYGAILHTYVNALGLATTDEYAWQGGTSRAIDFQFGRIVWSPTTGSVLTMNP